MSRSPLAEALGLIDPERHYFRMRPVAGDGEGWVPATVLTSNEELAFRQIRRAQERWDLRRREAAAYLVGSYAWGVGGPAVAAYVLARRVPDLSPENVLVRLDEGGGIPEAAVRTGRFATLASDPAAGHPEAVPLPGEPALLGWMRERLIAGLDPLVSLVCGVTRVGGRTLWGRAADLLAQSFLMVGGDTPDQVGYMEDARAFVSGLPFGERVSFFVVERGRQRRAFMTRSVCCQAYRNPEYGYCDSCPALSQEERERRAAEELAEA
ncbi:MAG: (2Fe-2S)-binding protein [Rubrobacter sp.]|nr:(2Fe-2S)-binding protein [Rubrobacter sp.]